VAGAATAVVVWLVLRLPVLLLSLEVLLLALVCAVGGVVVDAGVAVLSMVLFALSRCHAWLRACA